MVNAIQVSLLYWLTGYKFCERYTHHSDYFNLSTNFAILNGVAFI